MTGTKEFSYHGRSFPSESDSYPITRCQTGRHCAVRHGGQSIAGIVDSTNLEDGGNSEGRALSAGVSRARFAFLNHRKPSDMAMHARFL